MRQRLFNLVSISLLLLFASLSNANQLSEYTARYVQKANQLSQSEQVDEAISQLLAVDTRRAYDKAYVWRMLGVLYWQRGDSINAINYLSQAVKIGALKGEQAWITERMLADLYLNEHQFADAISLYQALVKKVPEGQVASEIWWRLVQSQYQLSKWNQVLTSLEHYKKNGGEMAVLQLSIQLGALLQLQKWQLSIPVLESIIELDPNNVIWWRQLSSVELRLGDQKQALNTLSLANIGGVALSEQDLHLLAQLYDQQGIPEQAAKILEQLDPNNQQLELVVTKATYWQRAKEWNKAIQTWLVAGEMQSQYYWDAVMLLQQQRQFEQSLNVLTHLDSNDPKVALAKTRAYFRLAQLDKALIEAKRANQYATTTINNKQAESWIDYLEALRRQNRQNSNIDR